MCEKCEQVEVEEDVTEVEIGENESGEEIKEVKTGELKISEEDLNAIEQMLLMDEIENRVIYITDEITDELAQETVQLVHKFNREDEGLEVEDRTPIRVYVSSNGGSIYAGQRIVSAIRSSDTPVITILEGGVAFSMGLVIWQAGHHRVATRFAYAMYHQLSAGAHPETLLEMKNKIKHFDKLQKDIDEFLVERTDGGLTMKKLKKKRKSNLDWFLGFEDFVKYKLVDEILE